jgi:8-oxo-dGTP diphosphatase
MQEGRVVAQRPRGQHVVAVAGLVLRGARVLALRRAATNLAGPGLWETVSGRVEHGEEPHVAVAREIAEETALEVHVEERPWTAYAALRRGEPMIVILYRARFLRGEVRLSQEHDAFAWLSAAEFRERSGLAALCRAVEGALAVPLL